MDLTKELAEATREQEPIKPNIKNYQSELITDENGLSDEDLEDIEEEARLNEVYNTDFSEEAEIIESEQIIDELKESPKEEIQEDVVVLPKHSKQAKQWMRAYESLTNPIWKWLYSLKFLQKGDKQAVQDFRKKSETQSVEQTQEDLKNPETYDTIVRYRKFQEVCDMLKLDEDEREEGIEVLSEIIAKYPQLQMGPELRMILWASTVLMVRVEPFLPTDKLLEGLGIKEE